MTDHVKDQLCQRIEELEAEKMELNEQLDALQEERDALAAQVENWRETAAQYARNEDFYHGIVRQIGELFGEEARTSDDGSVQDDVLALKVFELVEALAAPAVQGEPIAWVTADTVDGQTVNGKPRRIWWENNEGVGMPIYAAPQPAPDVTSLVEALARCRHQASYSIGDNEALSRQLAKVRNIVNEALDARKGGEA